MRSPRIGARGTQTVEFGISFGSGATPGEGRFERRQRRTSAATSRNSRDGGGPMVRCQRDRRAGPGRHPRESVTARVVVKDGKGGHQRILPMHPETLSALRPTTHAEGRVDLPTPEGAGRQGSTLLRRRPRGVARDGGVLPSPRHLRQRPHAAALVGDLGVCELSGPPGDPGAHGPLVAGHDGRLHSGPRRQRRPRPGSAWMGSTRRRSGWRSSVDPACRRSPGAKLHISRSGMWRAIRTSTVGAKRTAVDRVVRPSASAEWLYQL